MLGRGSSSIITQKSEQKQRKLTNDNVGQRFGLLLCFSTVGLIRCLVDAAVQRLRENRALVHIGAAQLLRSSLHHATKRFSLLACVGVKCKVDDLVLLDVVCVFFHVFYKVARRHFMCWHLFSVGTLCDWHDFGSFCLCTHKSQI